MENGMRKDDKELLGYGAGCIVAGLLVFAVLIFIVATAIKWAMN